MDISINPKIKKWEVSVEVPGDKSIAHRALLLSAISSGESLINNIPWNADLKSTYQCLKKLGVNMEVLSAKRILVKGNGLRGLRSPASVLDAGNSGTTARLLSGILVGQTFNSVITGDESLKRRPMNRIMVPLKQMGAEIFSSHDVGTLPLNIRPVSKLKAVSYTAPVASAQVKSAFLLAGLYAEGVSAYREPLQSRDHTEIMLRNRGLKLTKHDHVVEIEPDEPRGTVVNIPGDFSTAALLIALGLSLPTAQVTIKKIGLNPTRTAFLKILQRMGAHINVINLDEENGEVVGDLEVYRSRLQGIRLEQADIIGALDEIPLLSGLAALADGKTSIRGAEELAVKESNRLLTTATELRRWGVKVVVHEDGLDIWGGTRQPGQEFFTHGDHRIAMLALLLGANSTSGSKVKQAECLEISIPDFYKHLQQWQIV